MTDVETTIRTILINSTGVTDLVPATSIKSSWPTEKTTFPCITFSILDNFESEFYDDESTADDCQVEVHVFGKPSVNSFAIADAVSKALKAEKWVRYYSTKLVEDDLSQHWVMRYQNTVFS